MEKEKLIKLNIKLEKELDKDIIEMLDKVQNKTLFTKTAIRLAYQQMLDDPSIARVREPAIFSWDKFIQDVEDNRNNSISCILTDSNEQTQTIDKNTNEYDSEPTNELEDDDLEDDDLF